MSVVTCDLNRVMYETHCTKGWKMVNFASEYWNNDFFCSLKVVKHMVSKVGGLCTTFSPIKFHPFHNCDSYKCSSNVLKQMAMVVCCHRGGRSVNDKVTETFERDCNGDVNISIAKDGNFNLLGSQ